MAREARIVIKSETANLVRQMIDDVHNKTQDQIAAETGFPKSNVLTMIKQGRTRMPLDKIESFSKACGKTPDKLFRTALREYNPDLARLIGRLNKIPMFEGAEEIVDLFNTAVTESLAEAKTEHRDAADNQGELTQVLRLNASLDMTKAGELKRFIKTKMVKVMAGDEEVAKFAH